METEKHQKTPIFFNCILCDYKTCKRSDYNRHVLTQKHKWKQMETDGNEKSALDIRCKICDRLFKSRSGLWKHNKICKMDEPETDTEKETGKETETETEDLKSMIIEVVKDNAKKINLLINENKELKYQIKEQNKQIREMIPKIGNNNNSNNNIKQKFNINVFLNEKCKDAISINEFVEKIEISIKDLMLTREKGQSEGISNLIIQNMNKLSLYERPLHCTDKKREILYIKNDEWEKDENKEQINKAVKRIESKQLKNIQKWIEKHPNYLTNPEEQEEFLTLIRETSKSDNKNREKIIKNICNTIYLDK